MAVVPEGTRRLPHDRWRHHHAWERAGEYWISWDQAVFAVLIGIGGGIWNAIVNHSHIGIDILIALGIVAVAAAVSPAVVYVFSWLTAGGHIMRQRLATIEELLRDGKIDELLGLFNDLRASAVLPKKDDRISVSAEVFALSEEAKMGTNILKRLPRYGGNESVPPALTREAAAWVKKVTGMLEPWPVFKAQFSGTIAFDTTSMFEMNKTPRATQEVSKRLDILNDILEELVAEEQR